MATADYLRADVAIPYPSINSDGPKQAPRRSKWPAVRKVLKVKGRPSEDDLRGHRLELRTPEFQSTLTPFYQCFSDTVSIIKLLGDLRAKDSELATHLEAEHLSRGPDPVRQTLEEDKEISFKAGSPGVCPASVTSYIDFLSAFIGLFLQSCFLSEPGEISLTDDPHRIVSSLASLQCPEDLHIFRRVGVSPQQVANKFREGETPELHNGIPIIHLAKFLDIVVVDFLSSVTEHTSTAAVSWALNYLHALLSELRESMGLLSSPGWYGAPPLRSRKGTTTKRPSMVRAPILVPPVVVVGSLVLDPETGQPSPHSPSSPHTRSGPFGQRDGSPSSPRNPFLISPAPGGRGQEGRVISPSRHPQNPLFASESLPTLDSNSSSPKISSRVSPPRTGEAGGFGSRGDDNRARGRSPHSMSPPPLGSIREDAVPETFPEQARTEPSSSDQHRSPSPVDEVRSKVVKSPEIPEVDKESELKTYMNGEGRISLIAILTAVSNLPQSENLWTNEIGEKCFSLIQLCLDLGLPPKGQEATRSTASAQAQNRRQRFRAQDNPAFSKHGTEKPYIVHARSVVEASVNALIQCATSLMVGCVSEGAQCPLRYLRLDKAHSYLTFHTRLTRLLQRIADHSPSAFRRALTSFSQPSNSSARKLFHFLHVILQYCSDGELHGTNSLAVDVLVSVLRPTVDRLVELDITEESIQNSIVSEACSFFQFAHNVLSECSLSHITGSAHLEMYLHRIALSVILPLPRRTPETTLSPKLKDAASPLIAVRSNKSKPAEVASPTKGPTLPAKKGSVILQRTHQHIGLGERTRSGSLKLPDSPKPKGKLRKQRSLHSDIGRQSSEEEARGSLDSRPSGTGESLVGDGGAEEGVEWRGLQPDLLRGRVQRLVVLLNMSVPGTVPDPDMLASLIDLCDGKTVVARSMVLLECAVFVSTLRTQELPTVWVSHNKEHKAHLMHSVSHRLSKWGEAVSDKLRVIELRERELKNRLKFANGSSEGRGSSTSEEHVLEEEPVFPSNQEEQADKEYSVVSYAIKMAACQLLLEITRFLRDPPPQFCGWSINKISTSRATSVFADDIDRKQSITSVQSSDNESIPGIGPASLPAFERQSTLPVGERRFGKTLFTDEAEQSLYKQGSIEESSGSASPTKKRVSVYLRVNSTGGTISRSSSLRRSPKIIRVIDSPGQLRARTPSILHPRREVLTASNAGALHQSMYSSHTRGGRRPSVAGAFTVASHHPIPTKYRRQSVAGPLFKQQGEDHAPSKSSSGVTLSNLKNKARKAMHTLRRRPTKYRLTSESGLSPSNSPGRRRKIINPSHRSSQAGSFSILPVPPSEDRSLQCSWLRVIEHLIVVEHSSPAEVRLQHRLACRELLSALRKIYSAKYAEEEEVDTRFPTFTRSLSLMFTHRISKRTSEGEGPPSLVGGLPYRRDPSTTSENLSRRRSKQAPAPPRQVSSVPTSLSKRSSSKSIDTPSSFSSISFSRMSSLKLSSTPMRAGESDETIELFLESESTYPRAYLNAKLDEQRRDYLSSELPGMIHVPFSILVHAAPALHTSTLSRLKVLAWEDLLDTDTELSSAAGAFFLLACLKERSSGVRAFVKDHVTNGSPFEQLGAIRKFKVLWEARYHVWPRMEDRAQKKLCVNDNKKSEEDHIGYSLPANPLGQVADTLPLAPWDFSAVCTNKTCSDNPNLCYHSTQHVPVVHGDEIACKVKDYTVSGVSLLQEASNKPANVFLGIEADDVGNIEKWEAVKTTLFPHSLLPLIRFVILALSTSPSSNSHASTPSHPHTSTPSQDTSARLDMCELARQVVWQCMLEDEYLFFQPLLDQFNKLYSYIKEDSHAKSAEIDKLMGDILEPFHVILHSFHSLPSRAAHFLFNNFVGVVMKHTDQPVVQSPRIIQSMLTLMGMIAPSVQGLDSKVLKNSLKKENCYTTVMTTARIRGTEKVYVTDLSEQKLYQVTDGMTFAQLIAVVCGSGRVSLDLLKNWYLFDTGKDIPVLSSLYVQDQYSAPLDRQYPVFCLKPAERSDLWTIQMDQLFVHKMCELMRVQFAIQLVHTGPEVEKGVDYSEYAQPNHQFMYKELVELNSFPRKALTSVVHEAGQGALQNYPLRTSDIMLKGTWVRFILELFKSTKPDFNWSNNMVLFLNVINGSLLLHWEHHAILRVCLVSLLTAATKFNSVFKRDGYQMIVPVLIQVYMCALTTANYLIMDALKFAWFHFYLLDNNTFISQVVASASTLFSESVASLSTKVNSNYTPLPSAPAHMEGETLRKCQVKAVFELLNSLSSKDHLRDDLDLMLSCQQNLNETCFSRLNSDPQQCLSLENSAALLITLATWNPEALRGVQVLVCMDHLIKLVLEALSHTSPLSLAKSLEYLIRGCEGIARHHQFRRDNISTRKGLKKGISVATDPQTPGYPVDKTFNIDFEPEPVKPKRVSGVRKVSVVIQQKFRRLVNPNQKSPGLQGNLSDSSLGERDVRVREPPGSRSGVQGIDQRAITSQFKLRRLQHESQQILQLARDSLLSIATQFIAHFANVRISEVVPQRGSSVSLGRKISYTPLLSGGPAKQERAKVTLDSGTISTLTFVAIQLIKQGYSNERYEGVLQGRGLTGFMTCFLPNIEWSEPYFPSFQNLLNRLLKFFKYLQKESNKAMMVWDSLTSFISGLTLTIHNSPNLVQGQETNLQKVKSLLDIIVTLQNSGGGSPQNQSASALRRIRSIQRIQTPLLQGAPVSFSEAVVGLAVELIVLTHNMSQSRLRYHLSDLLYHKIIKEHEELLMSKIVLPVCIQLGLREDLDHPCLKDAEFVLEYIDKNVDFVIKPNINPAIMDQKLPPEIFFRDLKVVCLAFSETFTLQHWHKISQWIISLTQRKTLVLTPVKMPLPPPVEGAGVRASRLSSISTSSQTGTNTAMFKSFVFYHNQLLRFFESFLILHHIPLLSLLYPLLRVQESQLQSMLREVKSDSPALFEEVNQCIDRCHALLSSSFNSVASVSRHQLLRRVNDNLRHISQPTRVQRSATSVNPVKPLSKKKPTRERRNSYAVSTQPPLSKIGEEDPDTDFRLQTTTLPKKFDNVISPEHRPASLKWKGKSVPKHYIPPPLSHSKHPTTISLTEGEQSDQSQSRRPRRQAQRPKGTSLSTQGASPQKRSPKLRVLGKLGSSECHADTEDNDESVSPTGNHLSTRNPSFDNEYVIENLGSLSSKSSPALSKRAAENGSHGDDLLVNPTEGQTLLVSVEVHENHGTSDEHTPVGPVASNTSSSSAIALLSPEDNTHNGEGSGTSPAFTRSLPSAARLSAKQGGRARKVSFSNEVKLSSSLDRKNGKMLGSALKESSKYLYQSLEDGSD